MDRLTFDGNFCDIAQCQEFPCKYQDTGCSQKRVWERLKAIEDILGDNYELEELKQRWGYMRLIGKTVYGIRRTTRMRNRKGALKTYDRAVDSPRVMKNYPGECYVAERICVRSDLAKLGATVFLTKEEAEEAIGGADRA